jgi:hypothetical protein
MWRTAAIVTQETRKTLKIHNFFIDLKTKKDKTLTEDQWYVLAYYDPINDQQSETSIEIIVYHNLNGDEQFKSPQVTELLTEIYNALAHELKHQQQSIKRDFREWVVHPSTDDYKKYLANQDECFLVIEDFPTALTGEVTLTDITPEDFRVGGTPCYTNAISGEGIAQSNEVPPLASDICLYRNYSLPQSPR